MPYITKTRRGDLEITPVANAGELNYKITLLLIDYVNEHYLSYKTINDVVGALECAKQEFYRRVAVPYEDKKIVENGDIY